MSKKLFLLDAYALIYRAHFAFINNPLVNSKGQNVSAVTGFTNTLLDLLDKNQPTHIAVVFDSPDDETERAQEYEFYKANREAMPEDIQQAIPMIKQLLEAMEIPCLEAPGYEADDVIGTLAKRKEADGYTVYMVTPDKDYAQLVSDNIFMYKPGRQGKPAEILGVPEVQEQWEVERPEQVIDILGMWGDAVDNIPGLPGVGEKTAKKFIKAYGSMEALFENTHELKGKMKEKVEENQEIGLISKQLATIILDVPVEVTDEELMRSEPDKEKLKAMFTELEFRALGKRVFGDEWSVNQAVAPGDQIGLFGGPAQTALSEAAAEVERGKQLENTEHEYIQVDDEAGMKKLAEEMLKQRVICFDTETTGLDPLSAELVGISFSWEAHKGYWVPCPEDQDKTRAICDIFKPVLESDTVTKIAHNLKYDLKVLRKYDISVALPIYDTMLAHYLCESDRRHGMDYLAESFLGYSPMSIEELIGKKGKNQLSMRDADPDKVKEYAAEDADVTFQLFEILKPMVEKEEVNGVLEQIEHPLIPVLADMEMCGVNLDTDFLKDYSEVLQTDLLKFQQQIYESAGQEFNIDSPKQLSAILFEKMEIPYKGKKTKTGQYSTNEDTLSKLVKEHPIAEQILSYRELRKLKSTYVDALPQLVNPETGRIHTTFYQWVAASGRLASQNPNLQNIPIRTERGRKVREAFIPRDENHIILSADYSQIELRLAAEMSGDEGMLEAFQQGLDIHSATAARVNGVKIDEVTREMRSAAKAVNFGIIYSISAYGLSQNIGIPKSEAQQIIDDYFESFPRILEYMETTKEFARKHGYTKTLMGRKRHYRDINSRNYTLRAAAEREAVNSPIQGSAADMVKLAMISLDAEMKARKMRSRMTLQVHDELVFDAHRDEMDELKPLIEEKMRTAIPELQVPIVVDVGEGKHWLEAH